MKNIAFVSVLTLVLVFILLTLIKKIIFSTLIIDLKNKEYDLFDKKIHSIFIKIFLDKFTILEFRLHASILQNKKEEINLLFLKMESFHLYGTMKWKFYMKAFNYYIAILDQKNAFKYLNKINKSKNEQIKLEANRMYNIYILKNDLDLNALLEEISLMEDKQKAVHEYLVSLIYKNKKDILNYEKYKELSKIHFALMK